MVLRGAISRWRPTAFGLCWQAVHDLASLCSELTMMALACDTQLAFVMAVQVAAPHHVDRFAHSDDVVAHLANWAYGETCSLSCRNSPVWQGPVHKVFRISQVPCHQ